MRSTRARRGERGASLVEGAIVAPLFFLLIFTILEFGLVFRQYLTMSTADRNATRTASAAGNTAQADYRILQEVKRSSKALTSNELKTIVVFKAAGPNSSITGDASLTPCLTASVANVCNRYTAADLNLASSSFGNCASSTAPDRFWCPPTRKVAVSGPPDYIGVYITSKYQAITGIFGKSYNLSEQTIYRLEAQTR